MLDLPSRLRLHPWFHTSKLKRYYKDDNLRRFNVPADEVILADGERGYIVEKLLKSRKRKNSEQEFKVRWQGFVPRFDSWEPRSNLTSVAEMMDLVLRQERRRRRL